MTSMFRIIGGQRVRAEAADPRPGATARRAAAAFAAAEAVPADGASRHEVSGAASPYERAVLEEAAAIVRSEALAGDRMMIAANAVFAAAASAGRLYLTNADGRALLRMLALIEGVAPVAAQPPFAAAPQTVPLSPPPADDGDAAELAARRRLAQPGGGEPSKEPGGEPSKEPGGRWGGEPGGGPGKEPDAERQMQAEGDQPESHG